MTAPTGVSSGVGFRNAVLFELDSSGYPKATSTTAYEGKRISGEKTCTINDPDPRRISHIGDDSLVSIDMLPPTEAISGEMHTSKANGIIDAVISGQKLFTVGEASLFGVGTDKRGFEPQVAVLAYRQAQDTDPDSPTFGLRAWDFRIMPKVVLYARENGFADSPEDRIYSLVPMFCTAHLWGTVFSEATEGFARCQMLRGLSWYKPKIVAWKGDNATVEFLFPTAAPAVSVSKVAVWKNGVAVTPTVAVNKLTFSTAPATGDMIVAYYEVA